MSPQQQQLNKTDKKISQNNWMTALLIPIGIGIFWKCVQIYNVIIAQQYIDQAQNKDIVDLKTGITSAATLIQAAQNTNNDQDKEIFKLQTVVGILPDNKQFKIK